ncbi:heme peroxidase [Artemisia annua]|uniref:Peroxidase n=1 Tax=Artemisia annua TaxID=35608 RepID=A0A2U1NH36_ARTAN|nr:heme peroxidase [Artemisia annua]
MGYDKSIGTILVPIVVLLVSVNYMPCKAQLCTTFYDDTCPSALATIRDSVSSAVSSNRRMAALLIRLHFHDCFVQGCDASILLEGTGSEKASPANDGVLGYETVDDIKAAVESVCPGVVSCADILAVAARDASVEVGGPSWEVKLGRRDSTGSNASQAVTDLPRGNNNLTELIASFDRKGLSVRDMVALSGSHTIGKARCVRFRDRIYANNSNIDATFAANLRRNCPQTAPNGDGNLEPLDLQTPNKFDNNYFRNLVASKGLLTSDQVLFNGDSTDSIVTEYVDNPSLFDCDFAKAMVNMGDIEPLTGTSGIIRTLCSTAN